MGTLYIDMPLQVCLVFTSEVHDCRCAVVLLLLVNNGLGLGIHVVVASTCL